MKDIIKIVKQLILLPTETEWCEFKVNNFIPQEIGEYISVLSNSACYLDREKTYLIFGIDDKTHNIVGTKFIPKEEKVGNQELENWLITQLNPQIDFNTYNIEVDDKFVVVFQIDSAKTIPIKFKGVEYIRVGSYKQPLIKFPEKARKIWMKHSKIEFEKDISLSSLTDSEVLKLIDYPSVFDLLKLVQFYLQKIYLILNHLVEEL